MRKHQEHCFDNSQTGGFMVTLSDRFKKGLNTEFTVHLIWNVIKAQNNLYQFLTLKSGCDLYTSAKLYSSKLVIRKTNIPVVCLF